MKGQSLILSLSSLVLESMLLTANMDEPGDFSSHSQGHLELLET